MRRRIVRAAIVLAALWLVVAVGACASMRMFLYPAPRPAQAVVPDAGSALVRVDAPGEAPVFVLYAPPPSGARTVVHFHGNGEELAGLRWLASRVHDAGLGFAAIEYPGYGPASAQSPTEAGLYAAGARGIAHLARAFGLAPADTVLMGQSLGTGVAVEMAARGLGGRLALISPFTSMVDVVQRIAWFLPAGLVVRDRYDSAAKARAIAIPVLLVHGENDALVPAEMSAALAARFPQARRIVLPGRGHNDVWNAPGDALFSAVVSFARRPSGL